MKTKNPLNTKQSLACKEGTDYRKVMNKIVYFAEHQIKEKYPVLSYVERIIMSQEESFRSAAKELHDLTDEELNKWKRKN